MLKQLFYILILGIFFWASSCKVNKSGGWAPDFRYELDKERYNSKGSGKGWAGSFQSSFAKNRFNKSDGWASNFKSSFSNKSAGGGWASNFQSSYNKNRFNKSDGWASNFKPSSGKTSSGGGWAANFQPSYKFNKNCENKGWSIDFRSNLSPERFNVFNSNFYVMPASNYSALKFSDSFSTSKKSNEGGFAFNKKNKKVKQKWIFKFKSKPLTNDSFGPNVEKKDYKDNVYNKKKKKVTKTKGIFKRKKEKPYKRKKDMNLDLFQFKP